MLITPGINVEPGVSFVLPPALIEYLIVAGGGGSSGGNSEPAGGGGAGGIVSGSYTLTGFGTPITITIGAGGTGQTYGVAPISGTNSSMTGMTTAIGGGAGGYLSGGVGQSGGSGGGGSGWGTNAGGAGTAGQGYAGGTSAGSLAGYPSVAEVVLAQ